MSALQSALAEIRTGAADRISVGLSADQCAAVAQHIDQLTADRDHLRIDRDSWQHVAVERERPVTDKLTPEWLAAFRRLVAGEDWEMPSREGIAALLGEIDRLAADLAEARRQVQAACCGPWHEREAAEAAAAAFPWQRVKAAREVAARWHSHAHWQASQGPHEATVAWAVAQTLLSLVLDELDYDGIEPRNERAAGPAGTRVCTGCDGTGERRDFNADGEFESVERCGGCDGTGRVALEDESCDEDAPTCRDCDTWPCARHATDADRSEYEQATESGAAR